jgi:hypothetical protein
MALQIIFSTWEYPVACWELCPDFHLPIAEAEMLTCPNPGREHWRDDVPALGLLGTLHRSRHTGTPVTSIHSDKHHLV